MRVTKVLTTSVTAAALAFSMLASAIPATATSSGYHAAWVAQSAYATAAPGQVVQMSAVYQNTGDQPWIKGTAGQQANFAAGSSKDPAYPRDTTAYADAGWSSGQNWLSANRFAAQANDLVATSQLGSWVWSVKVPTTQAAGVTNFNGNPVIDGTTWMEDYGFFLQVTVTAGTVSVDSSSPASPANNATPAITGSGAPAGATVTLYDGATAVGTGTASSLGGFTIVSSALTEGSHTFSATATDSTSAFFASKNTLIYVYDKTKPTVTSVTARDARNLIVVFSEPVKASTIVVGNFTNAPDGGATTAATLGSDKMTVTVTLTSNLGNPSGQTLTIQNVQDLAGNVMTSPTLVPYTFSDTTPPTVSSASATVVSGGTTASKVSVTWSQAVQGVGTYSVDGVTTIAPTTGQNTNKITLTPASTSGLTAGSTHTVCSVGELDLVGNAQTPTAAACATFTVAAAAAATPLTIVSGAQGSTDNKILITWNQDVSTTTTGVYQIWYPGAATGPSLGATAPTSGAVVTLTIPATPWQAGNCGATATSCTVQISSVGQQDASGNGQNPSVQTVNVLLTKDTTAPAVVTTSANGPLSNGQTNIDLVYNKTLASIVAASFTVTNNSASSASCGTTACTTAAAAPNTLSAVLQADGKTVRLTRAGGTFAAGTYTVSIAAGAATDTSFGANTSGAQTVTVTVVDQTPPIVTGSSAANCPATCTIFMFSFSERVKTGAVAGSVNDINNWKLDGVTPSGNVTFDLGTNIATLTLSASPAAGGHTLVVSGVQDLAGNVMTPTANATLGFTKS